MQFPTANDSIALLLGLGRYAGSRVKADPDVSSLAALIRAPRQGLLDAIAARNAAEDEQIDAQAVADYHFDELNALVVEFGKRADTELGGRRSDAFLRLFPRSPSEMAAAPVAERSARYNDLVAAALHKETPEALRPTAKKVAEAWKKFQGAQTAIVGTEKAVEKAQKQVASARQGWDVGYTRLHAQLSDKFPRDKSRVERYFRKSGGKKKSTTDETAADRKARAAEADARKAMDLAARKAEIAKAAADAAAAAKAARSRPPKSTSGG